MYSVNVALIAGLLRGKGGLSTNRYKAYTGSKKIKKERATICGEKTMCIYIDTRPTPRATIVVSWPSSQRCRQEYVMGSEQRPPLATQSEDKGSRGNSEEISQFHRHRRRVQWATLLDRGRDLLASLAPLAEESTLRFLGRDVRKNSEAPSPIWPLLFFLKRIAVTTMK